jgi:hypothetical protein
MNTAPRDPVLTLCGECRWCMIPASQSDQETRWLERAIVAAPDPTDAIRAQALLALGAVRSQQQQLDLAQDLANEAMHMHKRLETPQGPGRSGGEDGTVQHRLRAG